LSAFLPPVLPALLRRLSHSLLIYLLILEAGIVVVVVIVVVAAAAGAVVPAVQAAPLLLQFLQLPVSLLGLKETEVPLLEPEAHRQEPCRQMMKGTVSGQKTYLLSLQDFC